MGRDVDQSEDVAPIQVMALGAVAVVLVAGEGISELSDTRTHRAPNRRQPLWPQHQRRHHEDEEKVDGILEAAQHLGRRLARLGNLLAGLAGDGDVVARAADASVFALPPDQFVVARAAVERVVAAAADQGVVA